MTANVRTIVVGTEEAEEAEEAWDRYCKVYPWVNKWFNEVRAQHEAARPKDEEAGG